MSKERIYTIQVLESPVMATLAAKLRSLSVLGFFDMTVDPARPETLMLVEGTSTALVRWHEETESTLVWSIEGDYLSHAPGAA